jgi:hypothetical protein
MNDHLQTHRLTVDGKALADGLNPVVSRRIFRASEIGPVTLTFIAGMLLVSSKVFRVEVPAQGVWATPVEVGAAGFLRKLKEMPRVPGVVIQCTGKTITIAGRTVPAPVKVGHPTVATPNHATAPKEPVALDELDQKLLVRLKEAAARYGFTPEALLLAGETAAEFQSFALVPIFGPFPAAVDEAPIDQEALTNWPGWVADLVPAGSKWERLHWPDGSVTVRLVNPRARVLAATRVHSGKQASQ